MSLTRYSTGYERLDQALGGGLLPGTLTIVLGATGIGKTHLGVSFASSVSAEENEKGLVLDLNARGDGQDHQEYADRLFGWKLEKGRLEDVPNDPFSNGGPPSPMYSIFEAQKKRVIRGHVSSEEWREWNSFIQRKINATAMLLYSSFIHGRRRVVIDGIEPYETFHTSAQSEFFDYCVERVIRKDATALARDAFRERFYENRERVERAMYDHGKVASMALVTSRENMLESLMEKPLEEGDLMAVANTVILAGRVKKEGAMGRALFVAKHRGSACSDDIIGFRLGDDGLMFE